MKRTIKSIVKLMSFGFIGLALLSCSKNETPTIQEKVIGFNSYSGRTVSKANSSLISATELTAGSKFGVYAYSNTSAFDATKITNVFMNNIGVTYAGQGANDETKYSYTPTKYWPNDETNMLSFFAYYPYSQAGINGFAAYDFTVQNTPAQMEDFMISEVANDLTYSNSVNQSGKTGVVKMKFHHALSMVKFKVNTLKDYKTESNTVIKLTEVKLIDVNSKGTITPQIATPFAAWSAQGTPITFDLFNTATADLSTTGTTAVFLPTNSETADAFLMVPQSLDGVKVKIKYTVQSGTDAMITNEKEIVLNTAKDSNGTTIDQWKMNQNIVYTFTIGLKEIKFIASVTDWDPITVPITVE